MIGIMAQSEPIPLTPSRCGVNDDEFCRSEGAKPGTPSYLDCRRNLSDQRGLTTPTAER
jgi:hypothetical protein